MKAFDAFRAGTITVISFLGSLCLAFLMLVVIADVIFRAINPSWRIFGVLDMVELSLAWLFFLAIPLAIFKGRVISVDLIDGFDRGRWFVLLGSLLMLGILLLVASQMIRPALDTLEWGEKTLDLGLPKFYYWIAIWVGVGLSCLAALGALIDWFKTS